MACRLTQFPGHGPGNRTGAGARTPHQHSGTAPSSSVSAATRLPRAVSDAPKGSAASAAAHVGQAAAGVPRANLQDAGGPCASAQRRPPWRERMPGASGDPHQSEGPVEGPIGRTQGACSRDEIAETPRASDGRNKTVLDRLELACDGVGACGRVSH